MTMETAQLPAGEQRRLQQEDPELTHREIQAAIWSVVDGSDFDVDMRASEMPPRRLTENGQLNFDKQKVNAIVNEVMVNASNHKYKTGIKHAVFISSSEEDQTVTVPSQETVLHMVTGFFAGNQSHTYQYSFRSANQNTHKKRLPLKINN